MSLLVRPTPSRSRDFFLRPNTYSVKFSTGADFYFSLPFDPNWLNTLRFTELVTLQKHLRSIREEVRDTLGRTAAACLLETRAIILSRLSGTKQLTPVEREAWACGHGFPIFYDDELIGFDWAWDTIYFEYGHYVVAWCVKWLYDFQNKSAAERYAIRRSKLFKENKITYHRWVEDGQYTAEWYCNGDNSVAIWLHGASFRDYDEWKFLRDMLEPYELELLEKGAARLCNTVIGGWQLVMYLDEVHTYTEDLYESSRHPDASRSNQNQASEQPTSPGWESWDECCCAHETEHATFTAPKQDKHVHSIHDSSEAPKPNCTSQNTKHRPGQSPPVYSIPLELLLMADTIARVAENVKPQLHHLNDKKTPPHPFASPCTASPLPCTCEAKSIRLLCPRTPKQSRAPRPYQAYAEEDTGEEDYSAPALPNSWRDV
jgi:hypothetical protein